MAMEAWSPRDIEDLVTACPSCGEYPTGLAFGSRDWLRSPDPMNQDELDARVAKARGGPPAKSRRTPTNYDLVEDDTATAEPAWTVDSSRVDLPLEPLSCHACAVALPVTWRDIASAHARLMLKDLRWLHGYVTMKETIRVGLRHRGVGLRGDLGTFTNVDAAPLYVPSQKLIDLVDKRMLDRKAFVANLARPGGPPCTRARVGKGDLPFPTGFAGPELVLDTELGIGLAEIARSLRAHGSTPLRGIGTLRIVDFEWGTDHGRLLYLDFDVRVRADVAARSC